MCCSSCEHMHRVSTPTPPSPSPIPLRKPQRPSRRISPLPPKRTNVHIPRCSTAEVWSNHGASPRHNMFQARAAPTGRPIYCCCQFEWVYTVSRIKTTHTHTGTHGSTDRQRIRHSTAQPSSVCGSQVLSISHETDLDLGHTAFRGRADVKILSASPDPRRTCIVNPGCKGSASVWTDCPWSEVSYTISGADRACIISRCTKQ